MEERVLPSATHMASRRTHTFSISVDDETRRILKEEADRSFEGNVSALVAAIAKQAKRQASLRELIAMLGQPPVTDEERIAFLAELDGARPKRRRSRAA